MIAADDKTQAKVIFPEKGLATHMPFLDGQTLVFCQSRSTSTKVIQNSGAIFNTIRRNPNLAEHLKDLPRTNTIKYRVWKIAYCNWSDKISRPIATGLDSEMIECSPALYRDKGGVHLSFIGGMVKDDRKDYRLYSMEAKTMEELGKTPAASSRPALIGFISPFHVCWGAKTKLFLQEKASGKTFRIKSDLPYVVRATFLSEDPSKLLITGRDVNRQVRTILHNLTTKETSEVSSNGSVYKSSLHGNTIVHALRKDEGIEERELVSGSYTLEPTTINLNFEESNV